MAVTRTANCDHFVSIDIQDRCRVDIISSLVELPFCILVQRLIAIYARAYVMEAGS